MSISFEGGFAGVQDPFAPSGLRRRILTLTGAYLPGFRAGGPIRSLRNLQEHFRGEIDFDVVTSDRDLGDTQPYPGVQRGEWNRVADQQVFYARPGLRGLIDTWRALRSSPHDLLYLNSFFSARTTTWALLLRALHLIPQRPVVLAPRGEFSSGALGLKSSKKKVFLRVLKFSPLLRGVVFQATSPAEVTDIRQALGNIPVREAPNLAAPPQKVERSQGLPGVLRVAFVGRVNRMKNLDFALKVLHGVDRPLQVSIVGPQEDAAYWQECQDLITTLPPHIQVEVLGPVAPEKVGEIFTRHDVLLSPTLGENFGHVIAEALTHGCIPVISDRTPWQGLQKHDCGFSLSLEEPARFTEAINVLSRATPQRLEEMSRNAIRYGLSATNSSVGKQKNRALFSQP